MMTLREMPCIFVICAADGQFLWSKGMMPQDLCVIWSSMLILYAKLGPT